MALGGPQEGEGGPWSSNRTSSCQNDENGHSTDPAHSKSLRPEPAPHRSGAPRTRLLRPLSAAEKKGAFEYLAKAVSTCSQIVSTVGRAVGRAPASAQKKKGVAVEGEGEWKAADD